MNFTLPKRAVLSGPNFIRSVFERGAGIPGFISFGIGNPASEAIPVAAIQKAMCDTINENPMEMLQYGPMGGDPTLATKILDRLIHVRHMPKEEQQLIISAGSGACLGLMPRTVCNEGDEVYMDAYSFTSGINAVRNAGAKAVGIPMDDDGMIPEELEKAAQSGKGKYIYLIPNFQNPTGITMSLERRKKIYEIASKYDLLIYEDDPYGEIHFTDEVIPTLKEMDTENRVIYAGSFSKTLAAGLRVGFLYGPTSILGPMQALKNNCDGQMPLITQRTVSRVLDAVDYDEQIKTVARVYKEKCDTLLNILKTEGSAKVKYTNPTGGMFVWMTMPDNVDCEAFFEACIAHKIGIVPGAAFAADGVPAGQSFRLSFTFPPLEKIEEGAKILAAVTKEFCD